MQWFNILLGYFLNLFFGEVNYDNNVRVAPAQLQRTAKYTELNIEYWAYITLNIYILIILHSIQAGH